MTEGVDALQPGKMRRLQRTARDGLFTVLAIDHRDALRLEFQPDDPEGVDPSVLTAFKLGVVAGLGTRPSAVLLDPEYSVGQAVTGRALPPGVGLLSALEAQGYEGAPTARSQSLLDGWGVDQAARLGVDGVKLLLLYRPDRGAATRHQEDLVREVVESCRRTEVPLFCEPIPYDLDDDDDRRRVIVTAVERLGELGVDVLKVPFPVGGDTGWSEACAELSAAAEVPWTLLSWGVSYERFREQLTAACEAGASGFLVGRALWRPALSPNDRESALRRAVVPRFDELTDITRRLGRPWWDAVRLPEPATFDRQAY